MYIVTFTNGWTRAINGGAITSVYVGQDENGDWGYCIDVDNQQYQIDEDELEILVEKRVATILKRDLEARNVY